MVLEVKPQNSRDLGTYLIKFILEDNNSGNCDCGPQSTYLVISITITEGEDFSEFTSELDKLIEYIIENLSIYFL